MKILKKQKIPVGLRLDPIIPFLNDSEIEDIIKELSGTISHLVASTFKARDDSWKRFKIAFPKIAKKIGKLYFKEGKRISRAYYLPEKIRKELILKVKGICQKYKIPFASCREGFQRLNTAKSCDGSHLTL